MKMKTRALLAGAMLVVTSVFSAAMLGGDAMAVKCPKGTLRADEEVDSLAECNVEDNTTGLMNVLTTVINVILAVVGFVAVVMIILGGISMITSQGDTGKVAKGRLTIIYGVVGLVIALLAFAIVNFVLTGVFNGNTTGGTSDKTGSSSTVKK